MALITVPTTSDGHTPDKCQIGDGFASITANPDDENSSEGVSLKNAFSSSEGAETCTSTPTIDDVLSSDFQQPEGYNWFFLRVNYGRAERLYNDLKERKDGYLLWMPYQKNVSYKDGMKIESLDPIFKSNLFIYATREQAFSLTHRAPETGYPYVDFAYDHTAQNEYGRDDVIIIPFRDMLRFIKAEHIHHPWAHVVEPEKIHFREGGMVRVIGGSFEGVEGYVARVFGQTRVVVTIKGIVNYATAYVSQKYLQPIEESSEEEAKKKPEAGNSIRNRVIRHELKVGARILEEEKAHNKKRRKKKN